MEKSRDWVVLYYDGRNGEHRSTVITSQRGPLIGRRIVRGREIECLEHYQQTMQLDAPSDRSVDTPDESAPIRSVGAG